MVSMLSFVLERVRIQTCYFAFASLYVQKFLMVIYLHVCAEWRPVGAEG